MKKLGNIVSDAKMVIDNKLFNHYTSIKDVDNDLPTLIIGLKKAQENIKSFSILQKQYNNIWWTFAKRERRKEYNDDLQNFKIYVVKRFLKNIRYEYVEFTCYSLQKTKKFIQYIYGKDKKICFLTRDSKFMFIYSPKYQCVWGLSLTLCDYIGIDKHKVINKVRSNKNNQFIYGINSLDSEIKAFIKNDTHFIPPLFEYFGQN